MVKYIKVMVNDCYYRIHDLLSHYHLGIRELTEVHLPHFETLRVSAATLDSTNLPIYPTFLDNFIELAA